MPVMIDVESEFLTGLFETFEKQRTINLALERELHKVIKDNESLISNDKHIHDVLKEIEMKLGKHKVECAEVIENNA